MQVVIKFSNATVLLFSGMNCRIMGSIASLEDANFYLYSVLDCCQAYYVLNSLQLVSQTYTIDIITCLLPINLSKYANYLSTIEPCISYSYEPEIFPALSLKEWKPNHVNIFSSGKVIILGHNTHMILNDVSDFIHLSLLLVDV